MYPVIYWVEGCDYDNEMYSHSGCTFAGSYKEAMELIESYYGDEICSIKMEMLEEATILEFKNDDEAQKQVSQYE